MPLRCFRWPETARLFHRESVRRFKAIERQALRKLDMLDAAPDLGTLATLRGNRLEDQKETEGDSTAFAVTTSGVFASCGAKGHAYQVEIMDYH